MAHLQGNIRYPYFARGRIFKIDMMENMRDYPRDAVECLYEDLSDGIVCGLSPIVDKDTITFSKGIIKYKGIAYLMNGLDPFPYGETAVESAIKIVFKPQEQTPDYKILPFDIVIDKNMISAENEIELCRFNLKKGAYLRSDYQDLPDFITGFNTINIVHVQYAGYSKPTMSHLVLKYFAKQALACFPQNPWDVTFAMLCLNSSRIERDVILGYLAQRLSKSQVQEDMANHEILSELVEALELIKKDEAPRRRQINQRAKITLD